MKFVENLSVPEEKTLRSMQDHHSSSRMRKRAQAIVLSHLKLTVQIIALITGSCRQTVSSWIKSWDTYGIGGLYDNPRSGQPPILNEDDVDYLMMLKSDEPRSVKKMAAKLEKDRGKKVSTSTIKRTLKKNGQKWKRIRKSLKGKRDKVKFEKAKERINNLEQRRVSGEVDLYYFDASGFNLNPCITYAWQPIGERVEVPGNNTHGNRINALCFLNKDNDIAPYCFNGTINSQAVISCFDDFSDKIDKKTFVLIDNAPVHRSKAFIDNLSKWHEKGLIPKFLPTYSPELNLIEILWKKIKYEWLPLSSYLNFETLSAFLEKIFKEFGSEYAIIFST